MGVGVKTSCESCLVDPLPSAFRLDLSLCWCSALLGLWHGLRRRSAWLEQCEVVAVWVCKIGGYAEGCFHG